MDGCKLNECLVGKLDWEERTVLMTREQQLKRLSLHSNS